MGTLFSVATPIGNLTDISQRTIETLKKVQFVIAEDTRQVKKLLQHIGIKTNVVRCDDHIVGTRLKTVVKRIVDGESAALVTDAGTPNVSDPGWRIIKELSERGVLIVPIPGPSAVTAALSCAHFPVSYFVFLGFPPHKKGRSTFFKNVSQEDRTVVVYESPHRIEKTLNELALAVSDREMLMGKELTKVHERLWRGSAKEIYRDFAILSDREKKGEFVIVISPADYGQK